MRISLEGTGLGSLGNLAGTGLDPLYDEDADAGADRRHRAAAETSRRLAEAQERIAQSQELIAAAQQRMAAAQERTADTLPDEATQREMLAEICISIHHGLIAARETPAS